MNHHYPKVRRHWQEKVQKKLKLTKLLEDDLNKFNDRHENINSSVWIININGFDQDQILAKTIEGIKFDFIMRDIDDQSEKIPFKFIIEKTKSRLQWNHNYENHLYRNEEFIDLVEKYSRMYYAIKILDTNMDYVKLQIRQLYPEFHRIDCDYRYKYTDDEQIDSDNERSDSDSDSEPTEKELKIYMYKFSNNKVYLGWTSRSLNQKHHDHKSFAASPMYQYLNSDTIKYKGPTVIKTIQIKWSKSELKNYDHELYKTIRQLKKEYNITDDQLINRNKCYYERSETKKE